MQSEALERERARGQRRTVREPHCSPAEAAQQVAFAAVLAWGVGVAAPLLLAGVVWIHLSPLRMLVAAPWMTGNVVGAALLLRRALDLADRDAQPSYRLGTRPLFLLAAAWAWGGALILIAWLLTTLGGPVD
ncbi:MAG: hypothetical protein JJU45_08090 [Acidimicrobiia bacterium]|nr:hypothetical protein [Acidimicrobiia bacterium]